MESLSHSSAGRRRSTVCGRGTASLCFIVFGDNVFEQPFASEVFGQIDIHNMTLPYSTLDNIDLYIMLQK